MKFKRFAIGGILGFLLCFMLMYAHNRITNHITTANTINESKFSVELDKEYVIVDYNYVVGNDYIPGEDFFNTLLVLKDSDGNIVKKSIDNMTVTMDEYFVPLFTDLDKELIFNESTVASFMYDKDNRTLKVDLKKKES